jgi:tRNA threonylcarbamoyladenosine biosynthesis protein TsaE
VTAPPTLAGGGTFRCPRLEDTEALGGALARLVRAGDLVLLHGDLGAGKTAFVRGLAAGLGCDPDEVSSPTFVIVQEYRGKILLRHVDLYRLDPGAEVDELGLDELRDGAVVAVEWAERLGPIPAAGAWRVEIGVADEDARDVVIHAPRSQP